MQQTDYGWRLAVRRWLVDFALVMTLFWAVPYFGHFTGNHAHAVPAPSRSTVVHENLSAQAQAWTDYSRAKIHLPREARTAHTRAMILFSIAVSALAAFNLAFWRHLRRVYASPRRGVWRRG